MSKREIIYNQLTELAFQESTAFCYSCYIKAPTGKCNNCGSDDLMRVIDGVGCEWGTEWVIEEILKEHLKPVNQTEAFESMMKVVTLQRQKSAGWSLTQWIFSKQWTKYLGT